MTLKILGFELDSEYECLKPINSTLINNIDGLLDEIEKDYTTINKALLNSL